MTRGKESRPCLSSENISSPDIYLTVPAHGPLFVPASSAEAGQALSDILPAEVYQELVVHFDEYYCRTRSPARFRFRNRFLDLTSFLSTAWNLHDANSPLRRIVSPSELISDDSAESGDWIATALVRDQWERERNARIDDLPNCPAVEASRSERATFCGKSENATNYPESYRVSCRRGKEQ